MQVLLSPNDCIPVRQCQEYRLFIGTPCGILFSMKLATVVHFSGQQATGGPRISKSCPLARTSSGNLHQPVSAVMPVVTVNIFHSSVSFNSVAPISCIRFLTSAFGVPIRLAYPRTMPFPPGGPYGRPRDVSLGIRSFWCCSCLMIL